jgi:hypothetical protein
MTLMHSYTSSETFLTLHRWDEQSNQNTDDRDNDEEFD